MGRGVAGWTRPAWHAERGSGWATQGAGRALAWSRPSRLPRRWDSGQGPASGRWGRRMKVIEHSEQVLRMALISKNTQLVKLYENLESREKCLLNEAFQPDSVLFRPITLHSESDWISSHPEPTQDFEQFYNDPYRSRPTSRKSTIYVQPIGNV